MIEFIYKSPSQGHAEYKYKQRNIRKNNVLYKQWYNDKEKTASSKLVGV